jgi:hypothetical protein
LVTHAAADDAIPAPGMESADHGSATKEPEKPEQETITITGKRLPESELVGEYNQPVWTTKRRFPTTRVYVIPAGAVSFEYWFNAEGKFESDARAAYESRYEVEFGLGKHFQFDVYLITEQSEGYKPLNIGSEELELRWAPADWGKIWGNPTLYASWSHQNSDPQNLELKLLVGDQINPKLFWGANLIYERLLGKKTDQTYALSFGLAYVVVEGLFSVGFEGKISATDEQDSRFDFTEKEFLFGPSFQLKPMYGIHIDLVPLFGAKITDKTSGVYSVFFIIGKEISGF